MIVFKNIYAVVTHREVETHVRYFTSYWAARCAFDETTLRDPREGKQLLDTYINEGEIIRNDEILSEWGSDTIPGDGVGNSLSDLSGLNELKAKMAAYEAENGL